MPTEVELVLVANNKDAVKGVRELASESQKLYTNNEKQQKRQVGLIADIEKELGKLQTAQKNALTIEHIEKYNRKIAEAKQALDEYNKAGLKAQEQTESNIQKIGKWAAGLGLIATLLNELKKSFADTVLGINAITQAQELWAQMTYNVVTANGALNTSLVSSIAIGKQINELRKKERGDIVSIAKLQKDYNELYFAASDRRKTDIERIQLLDQATLAHNAAVDLEIDNLKEQQLIVAQQLVNRPKSNKLLDEEARLNVAIQNAEASRFQGLKRLEGLRTGMIQEGIDREKKAQEDLAEDKKKIQEDSLKVVQKNEEEALAFEKKMRRERERLGLDEMQRLEKEYKDKKKLEEDKVKNQIDIEKKYYEWFWEQSDKVDKANKEQADKDQDLKEQKIDAFKGLIASADEFTLALYDRQFSKLENQYNKEADIEEKKFNASIKSAGKNEKEKARLTEDYNLRREKAEENYNKKKNEINRKAAIADKLAALFNIGINTAVGITKAFPNVFLQVLIAAAGALQAATVAAKPIPQFAKGGWTGNGFQRDSSGERMAGVVHEREFVVKRGPAHKFRDVLEAINRDDRRAILNSFNKVIPEVANTILVENNGPNKRLDEVNNNLRKIQSKEEVTISGNTIIYKKGNTIRTIKK